MSGPSRRMGRGDRRCPVRLDELQEVEIARIVDRNPVARREEEPAREIDRLRRRIGDDDLRRIDPQAALDEPRRDEAAQRLEA